MEKLRYALSSAFLHEPLALQIMTPMQRNMALAAIQQYASIGEPLASAHRHTVLTDALLRWMEKSKEVHSLEEMLIKDALPAKGQMIWIEQDFFFKGTMAASGTARRDGSAPTASFRQTLKRYEDLEVSGTFNVQHLFGDSSASRLSGKKTVFLFGFVEEAAEKKIVIRPVLIGDKMLVSPGSRFELSSDKLQVHAEEIDEFTQLVKVDRREVDLSQNRSIPEAQIKQWFGELLHTGPLAKDWGGEYGDIFSNSLHVAGSRCNAAFLLKGPSKFHPMGIKDLGKQGDQVVRLYDLPADVFILQHCHTVKAEIVKMMKAFSGQFDRMSRFCIIDGYDTLRILKAYGKIT